MKRLEISLLIALVFGIVLSITSLNVECDDIRESVLRLHVLANSDDEADQNLKLKVRDRLLEVSNDIYSNAKTREDAVESTESNLALLQSEAQKVVIANGYNYPVSVELEDTYFTTRTYENITLPAGEYKALRVIIGEGAGHNWWCVMFPPLCISAASDNEAQLDDVLTDEQMEFVQGTQYEARFKCVEWYEEIKQYFDFK
ncbi:MAG: stage II sporulation protein R [Firmicutes bacterium]|nr:stage II sporulation protein R [Bacillota bacterium]